MKSVKKFCFGLFLSIFLVFSFCLKTVEAQPFLLTAVIDIYQTQRAMMPNAVSGAGRQRRALIDILDEFDGLILDGYGVINVGANDN